MEESLNTVKKLIDFLFVRRQETENKWWHRLFVVLLSASGAVVFAIAVFLSVESYNQTWVSYKPVAFSLEPNYQTTSGKELSCSEDLFAFHISNNEPVSNGEGIKCEGIELSESDSKQYAKLYNSAQKDLEKQFGLDKYNCPSSVPGSLLTQEQITCIKKMINDEQADPAYSQYQDSLKNLARIKVARDVNYSAMFSDIFLWLIIPILSLILWVIFWSSVIYRSVLYIIFGSKK